MFGNRGSCRHACKHRPREDGCSRLLPAHTAIERCPAFTCLARPPTSQPPPHHHQQQQQPTHPPARSESVTLTKRLLIEGEGQLGEASIDQRANCPMFRIKRWGGASRGAGSTSDRMCAGHAWWHAPSPPPAGRGWPAMRTLRAVPEVPPERIGAGLPCDSRTLHAAYQCQCGAARHSPVLCALLTVCVVVGLCSARVSDAPHGSAARQVEPACLWATCHAWSNLAGRSTLRARSNLRPRRGGVVLRNIELDQTGFRDALLVDGPSSVHPLITGCTIKCSGDDAVNVCGAGGAGVGREWLGRGDCAEQGGRGCCCIVREGGGAALCAGWWRCIMRYKRLSARVQAHSA